MFIDDKNIESLIFHPYADLLQTVCVVMQQHFQSRHCFDLKFRLSCDELMVIVFFNQSIQTSADGLL